MESGIMVVVWIVLIAALAFALTNGLHDASSVVATMIACGAATPVQAVLLASCFDLLGAFLGGNAVANTIIKIIDVPLSASLLPVLITALLGAVIWNLFTWYLGLPSSSTHALVGGLIGSVVVSYGVHNVNWGWRELIQSGGHLTGIIQVVAALLFSPVLGFILAFVLHRFMRLVLRNADFSINIWLRRIQWVMAALLAFSHGANDTQKVMGLMTISLVAGGLTSSAVTPWWIRFACGIVMFIGTLLGGWSIMKTLGRGIFELKPIHSLNSQISSGAGILMATLWGAPVSTTHVVAGTIIGAGAADEYRMVNWTVGKEMIKAWFVTIPCSAVAAALLYLSFSFLKKIV